MAGDDRTAKISALLHEAAETHHRVFRITDGTDEDWATWYADWLVNLSELPDLLGVTPTRAELTYVLFKLDREFKGEGWEDHYATVLVRHFTAR